VFEHFDNPEQAYDYKQVRALQTEVAAATPSR
jgi:hypothetical protein